MLTTLRLHILKYCAKSLDANANVASQAKSQYPPRLMIHVENTEMK